MNWVLGLLLLATPVAHGASVGPGSGSLIVVGGGKLPPAITQRFVELAGGPESEFVVIPTALGDAQLNLGDISKSFTREFGVKKVTVLHTRDRSEADSLSFIGPLTRARGVWITGGRQWRLADAYLGTRTEREIKAVLERGGVVGGSSAGATIQGSYLVRGASATSGNPDGDNRIMMAKGHETGFGLLHDCAIDQHVVVRHRENDMVPVIEAHPGLLGIGIDESTAIVVHGDEFEVIGSSVAGIYDGKEHEGRKYYFLSPGKKFDLKKRAVKQ
jgi:cyanophycinase